MDGLNGLFAREHGRAEGPTLARMRAARSVDQLADVRFNYAAVGATAGGRPTSTRAVRHERTLGRGPRTFEAAAEQLLGWELQRRSGLTVQASSPTAVQGTNVLLGFGVGRLRLGIPCRVVYVVDEPARQGFAYGTLVGHPEAGEETFVVELREDGAVAIVVTAFSQPALWWSRLGRPVGRRVQARMTDRYLNALVTDRG